MVITGKDKLLIAGFTALCALLLTAAWGYGSPAAFILALSLLAGALLLISLELYRRAQIWGSLVSSEIVKGDRDSEFLKRRYPLFRAIDPVAWGRIQDELRDAYEDYVANTSDAGAAVSFQLATLLVYICQTQNPRRLLDLGSGFSSFILRRYAATQNGAVSVTSIDDSGAWLEKTKAFLSARNVSTDRVITWEALRQDAGAKDFDLVLNDFSNIDTRLTILQDVVPWVKPGGLLILDDMHMLRYRAPIEKALESLGLKSFSLRRFCLDEIGRYPYLVIR